MPTNFGAIPELADYLNEGYWNDTDTIWEFRGPRSWTHQNITVNMANLTAVEQNLATLALSTWSDVVNLNFVIGTGAADIWFWHHNPDGSSDPEAFTRSDVSSGGLGDDLQRADIYITSNWWGGDTRVDGYLYQTYVHEIGHALGLGHSGPYNNQADYSTDAIFTNDTLRWTVMSYFNQAEAGFGDTNHFVLTPQMADIYAAQQKYGAPTDTRTGNTTYGFNSNAGMIYDFTSFPGRLAFTIYDSAGIDTLDASGYGVAQVLSLESGAWSSTGGAVNNIGIALSATIENAVGGSAGDQIFGNQAANSLNGGGGADAINAGANNDIVNGGSGDDTLNGEAGDDSLVGFIGNDTLNGGADNDVLRPDAGADIINGGDGSDTADFSTQTAIVVTLAGATTVYVRVDGNVEDSMLNVENVIGGSGADTLTGDFNNNALLGGPGDDLIDGGASPVDQDVLNGNDGVDTVSYLLAAAGSGVNVNLSLTGPQNTSAAGTDIILNFENLTGSPDGDTLTGNSGDNVIDGGGGSNSNDFMDGADGSDTASYASSPNGVNVSLATAGIQDTGGGLDILLNFENLLGSAFADTLIGDGNPNTLRGGFGGDVLQGGLGDDVYVLDTVHRPQIFEPFRFDTIIEAAGEGIDTVLVKRLSSRSAYTLAPEVEKGFVNSADGFALTGNELSNALTGNAGFDFLDGGGGASGDDIMDGAGSIDTAGYLSAAAAVSVSLAIAGPQNTGGAGSDTLINFENLTGSQFNDTLTGDGGSNVLNGYLGADVLIGGGGANTYMVDAAADRVVESGGGGDDTVLATVSYRLGANQKIAILTTGNVAGTDAIELTGNNLNQLIEGNAGANILRSGGGFDTMFGLGGDDQYHVDGADDVVIERNGEGTGDRVLASVSYTLGAGVQVEIMSTTNHGGTGAINLTGNEFANAIYGNAGANSLNGAGGVDSLAGFGGNDFFFVDNAADAVSEMAGEGTGDRVFAGVSYVLGAGDQVEIMSTTLNAGTGAINLTGNEFANAIYGNAGINTLDGRAGVDSLIGFGGNDRFFVDNAADAIFEGAGEGTGDRVFASVSYALGAGDQVEIMSTTNNGGTGAISLTGNEFVNTIFGNAGANTLDGRAGADSLIGFAGNDFFIVDNAGDAITEGSGQGTGDRVLASVSYTLGAGDQVEIMSTTNNGGTGAINLTGNEFANSIFGNAGSNVLNGKAGNDTLTGFGGSDFFLFDTALNAATNVDRIGDFNVAADTIRLENAVFTALGAPGTLSAAAFRIGAAAADASDRIVYNSATGALIYDANGNAGGGATQFATLAAALAMTNADFVVV